MAVVLFVDLFVVHYVINSFVLAGPGSFNGVLAALRGLPLITAVKVVFLAVPLIIYIFMGLVIVYRSSANVISYNYYWNWIYLLQRVSGIVGFAFVLIYGWSMHLGPAVRDGTVDFNYVQRVLAPGWMKAVFIAGLVALVFHLSTALATALMTWGVVATRRARFAAAIASWVVMIVLWVWGIRILLAFMM